MCNAHYKRWYRHGDPLIKKCAANGSRTKHPLYSLYTNMKTRCFNPNNLFFIDYGGRGITVCDRWLGIDGFDNFCNDMGDRPVGYTLERKDNDKPYHPNNCIWADLFTQAQNKRIRRCNTSGVEGVSGSGGIWHAYITRYGKKYWLGRFKNIDDAADARRLAEVMYS